MGAEAVKDLVVFLRGDNKDFNAKIKDAQSSLGALQSSLTSMSTKMGIAFTAVGGAVTGFLGLCLKAAGDGEKDIAKLNQVIKSTGGVSGMTAESAEALAGSLQRVTTFSKGQIIEGENLLLTFTGIGKDVFPATTEACLNLSTALGQDMKSSAIQIGKALNDPIKGVTALQRVGVSFTAQQREQIKTLVESGHTMEAQKLILKELETEFGGQARAQAQTFEGSMKNLTNTVMSLKKVIGEALLPTFKSIVGYIKPVIVGLVDLIKAHKDIITQGAPVAMALGMISTTIGGLIMTFKGADLILMKLGLTLSEILTPIGIVIAILGALYLAWKNNFLGIRDVAFKVWGYLKSVFEQWRAQIPAILNYLSGVWAGFKAYVAGVWESLKQVLTEWYEHHRATIEAVVQHARAIFIPLWGEIKSSFTEAWQGIMSFWEQIRPYLVETWDGMCRTIGSVLDWLMDFWSKHWEDIRDVLITVWNVIKATVKTAWDVVSGTLKVGIEILSGEWGKAWDDIKSSFLGIWDNIVAGLKKAWESIKNTFNEGIQWVEGALKKIPGVQTALNAGHWIDNNIIPHFAGGGMMANTGMALVGEYGPELVRLPGGSRVYSNDESRAMSGGGVTNLGGITINISTTGGVDRGLAQVLAAQIYDELRRKGARG